MSKFCGFLIFLALIVPVMNIFSSCNDWNLSEFEFGTQMEFCRDCRLLDSSDPKLANQISQYQEAHASIVEVKETTSVCTKIFLVLGGFSIGMFVGRMTSCIDNNWRRFLVTQRATNVQV